MEIVFGQNPFILTRSLEFPKLPNAYLELLSARSPRTVRSYGYSLLAWFNYCESNGIDWDNPGQSAVMGYFGSLRCSNSTHNYHIARVHEYYQFAVHYGVPNPFVRLIAARNLVSKPTQRPFVQLPSLTQVSVFFKALKEPYQSMGLLMLYCGLRRSEVVGILTEQLNGEVVGNEVRIIVSAKGGGERMISMQPMLHDKLRRFAVGRYVFMHGHSPYAPETISKAFKIAAYRTGVEIHPHMLRHLFTSHRFAQLSAALNGRPQETALSVISCELGHKHLGTTLKYISRINANSRPASHCEFVEKMIAEGAPQ